MKESHFIIWWNEHYIILVIVWPFSREWTLIFHSANQLNKHFIYSFCHSIPREFLVYFNYNAPQQQKSRFPMVESIKHWKFVEKRLFFMMSRCQKNIGQNYFPMSLDVGNFWHPRMLKKISNVALHMAFSTPNDVRKFESYGNHLDNFWQICLLEVIVIDILKCLETTLLFLTSKDIKNCQIVFYIFSFWHLWMLKILLNFFSNIYKSQKLHWKLFSTSMDIRNVYNVIIFQFLHVRNVFQ